MNATPQLARSKRRLSALESDVEELALTDEGNKPPNHGRFFASLTTEPLIEWVLTEGNLESTEKNPIAARGTAPRTKAMVWASCGDFVVERVRAMVQKDRSLEEKANKELAKIHPPAVAAGAGVDAKKKEAVAAEWARSKVRHLAACVRRTYNYVYWRPGPSSVDGAHLEEQAERLCPHFADLKKVFDKTFTHRVQPVIRSSMVDPLKDDINVEAAGSTEDTPQPESAEEEDDHESTSDAPSSKKQKLVDLEPRPIHQVHTQR
ncbi:hypothetical protein DFQ26_003894 [Actinomortierella ambigua]|nr:hypothetical protein DFQ26_003894 [Actinomortierella ambigua]